MDDDNWGKSIISSLEYREAQRRLNEWMMDNAKTVNFSYKGVNFSYGGSSPEKPKYFMKLATTQDTPQPSNKRAILTVVK